MDMNINELQHSAVSARKRMSLTASSRHRKKATFRVFELRAVPETKQPNVNMKAYEGQRNAAKIEYRTAHSNIKRWRDVKECTV